MRSVATVSTFRGLDAVLTLVLGVLSSKLFGTSVEKDCYLISQTLPTLLNNILISGVYSVLLVSLSEVGARQGAAGQIALTRTTLKQVTLLLAPFVLAAALFPEWIVRAIAPGFAPAQVGLAGRLLIMTTLTMVASVMLAVFRALFHMRLLFAAPGSVNLLMSATAIATLLLLSGRLGIFALALGPLAGAFLAVGGLWLLAGRSIRDPAGSAPEPVAGPAPTPVRGRIWREFFWMSLGANFGQVNLLIDNLFGSFLPIGSIALLGFAFVIVSNAQGLTTYSLAEVALPVFAAAARRGGDELAGHLRSNQRYMLLVTAPLAAGCLAFGAPVARALFERGEFGPESTAAVGRLLACYAPHIVCAGYVALFWRVLVARRCLKAIGWASVAAILMNALLDGLLMRPFGVQGIALATAGVSLMQAMILGRMVRGEGVAITGPGDGAFAAKVLASAALMAAGLVAWRGWFEARHDVAREIPRLIEALGGIGLGAGAYLGLLLLLKVGEARIVGRLAGAVFPWARR